MQSSPGAGAAGQCLLFIISGIYGSADHNCSPARRLELSKCCSSYNRFFERDRRARRRLPGVRRKALLLEPLAIEQSRLILCTTIAQNCDNGVPAAEFESDAYRCRDVDAAGAAEEQAFLAQQTVNKS